MFCHLRHTVSSQSFGTVKARSHTVSSTFLQRNKCRLGIQTIDASRQQIQNSIKTITFIKLDSSQKKKKKSPTLNHSWNNDLTVFLMKCSRFKELTTDWVSWFIQIVFKLEVKLSEWTFKLINMQKCQISSGRKVLDCWSDNVKTSENVALGLGLQVKNRLKEQSGTRLDL